MTHSRWEVVTPIGRLSARYLSTRCRRIVIGRDELSCGLVWARKDGDGRGMALRGFSMRRMMRYKEVEVLCRTYALGPSCVVLLILASFFFSVGYIQFDTF